jgi:hypothetical protein
MRYDCVLRFQGEPAIGTCRDVDKKALKSYYIGYFIRLTNEDIKVTVRKTYNRPPTSSDRHMRKSMVDTPDYLRNIFDYLRKLDEARDKGETDPQKHDGHMVFTLHDAAFKKDIKEFLENADIHRTLLTIKHGGL